MRIWLSLILLLIGGTLSSQVNTFPYSESFEETFTTGTDITFITHWTANRVANSNRIYQGSDALTGSSSLNVIPISSFSGEIELSLNLSGVNNPIISFYAYSKKNGSSSSSRPVILKFSTSIDGGTTFLDDQQIGDETTFPNDNSTSYTRYNYELPSAATNQSNVIVKITASRGSGSGSAAELIIDDFLIERQDLPLEISSAISTSSTTVVVTFNQDVTETSAKEASNYSISKGIKIFTTELTSSNQTTLTTSELSNAEYSLTASNIKDKASETVYENLTSTFSYIQTLSIEEIRVMNKNSIEVDFNLPLEKSSAESVINYEVNQGIGKPISTQLMTESNTIKLSFGEELTENEYELTINEVRDESTLAVASNLAASFNYLPLKIEAIRVNSITEVEITFNQAIDHTSATTLSNYTFNYNIGSPTTAVLNKDDSRKIMLTLGSPLVNNTYTLTIDLVKNEKGNAEADKLSQALKIVAATKSRQIVINEIFADPSGDFQPDPQVLPGETDSEFVELYNTTDQAIDISDFELSGGKINPFMLGPKAYVTLTKSSNLQKFKAFGDVVNVTSWNTLTNGGEFLTLTDNLGNLVDSLTYNISWYKNDEKSDGGWSIEQINPERSCSDIDNWTASTNSAGGTPGIINSVLDLTPDTQSPNLISVTINSESELALTFDELMDIGSLVNATYALGNEINVTSVDLTKNARSVNLNLDQPLTSGITYTLSISGATDCVGNILDRNESTFLFDNLPPSLERIVLKDPHTIDLIFDEIITTNSAEDKSNYHIESISEDANTASLSPNDHKRVQLNFTSGLMIDSTYTLAYRNLSDTLNNTIQNGSFSFTFENLVDTLVVVSNHLLDVYFKVPPEPVSAEKLYNYSLNNSIGPPEVVSVDTENNALVHLVFSDNFRENKELTLSFEDILDYESNPLQLLNTSFIYDTDDPDVDSVVVLNDNSLRIYFDEPLDLTSAESINNYLINRADSRPILATLSDDKSSVTLFFPSVFEAEKTYRLTLTGIEDLYGNRISTNRNFNFVFDLLPPKLLVLNVLSPKEISLEFSEVLDKTSAETASNYAINNEIGSPLSAHLSKRDSKTVIFNFEDLGSNGTNTIEILNISDLQGNVANLRDSFSTLKPTLGKVKVLSDISIELQFSKVLDSTTAQDLTNYSSNEILSIESLEQDENDGSIVNIIMANPMTKGSEYSLSIKNLEDIEGNKSDPISHNFTFDNFISAVKVINPNTLLIDFEVELLELNAETTANYLLTTDSIHPLSAIRNIDMSNEVTLFFEQPLQSDFNYSLRIQGLTDVFEDNIPSASIEFVYDVSPPEILSVNAVYLNEIEVVFSEPVDPSTSQSVNHYVLNNEIEPISVSYHGVDQNIVLLTFLDDLSDGVNHTLSIKRVQDLSQNAIENSTFDFFFSAPEKPAFRELVINEVYFDTKSDALLPNSEFIEIYNRAEESFLLTDFKFTDKRDTARLPSMLLAANSHLILTSQAGEGDYSIFGSTRGVSDFPSLSNAGETIILLDRDFNIIDSLSYDQSYYNDTQKAEGGFTIELINPEKTCFDSGNYHASKNDIGGTPGRQNSVFDIILDVVPPSVSSLSINDTNQLTITFDEAMDVSSITKEAFSINGGPTVSNIELVDYFGKEVLINLSSPFIKGEVHGISVSGVKDCTGNQISDTQLDFSLGASPLAGELIITEIMAEPSPTQGLPEAEYLEVLNMSDKILSLNGVSLSDATNTTTLTAFDLKPGEFLILTPTSTAAQFMALGHVLSVNNWPSLNNAGDKISLNNPSGDEIFSIHYGDSWYGSATKAEGGFSLEIIDPSYPCLLEANWAGSENSLGGSPGTINSVNGDNPDLQGPEIINAIALDQSTIQVHFNEKLNGETITPENFSASNGLAFIAVILNEEKTTVTLTTSVDLIENTIYAINLNNITDCSGNLINSSNSTVELIVAGKADPLDILVNEILFNPKSGGVRFVEIYNNSEKYINLKNWSISGLSNQKVISEENLFISPSSFSTITNDGDILSRRFPNALPQTFIEIGSMPSLASDRGSVFLVDESNIQIDSFAYDEDYHSQLISNTEGLSLERLRASGDSNDPNNWFSAASTSNNATPGYKNSQTSPLTTTTGIITIDPPVFAPDIPGLNNFTTINYTFDTPGNVVNLKIVSADGRLIKQIVQNAVSGTKGFFRWDGVSAEGTKAPIGYYMIVFEVISPSGDINYLLDKVAIGGRF